MNHLFLGLLSQYSLDNLGSLVRVHSCLGTSAAQTLMPRIGKTNLLLLD